MCIALYSSIVILWDLVYVSILDTPNCYNVVTEISKKKKEKAK